MAILSYPKIQSVIPQENYRLLILFDNGVSKIYDCKLLFNDPMFQALSDERLFQSAKRDFGGYGVVWDDDLDLSESELWENGIEAAR